MSVLMNQESRFIGWTGDCAKAWVLLSLEGEEAVSSPYRWLARFTTANGADATSWLGKEVACRIGEGEQQRWVHGVVMQLEQDHHRDGLDYYHAVIEPRLVLTRLRKNLRVFQRTTVPDLVLALLKEHDVTDVKLSLSGDYQEQEYFIQYCESDFDFISRLLENAGISYFFTHREDKHEMVLADHDKAWTASKIASLPFHPTSGTQDHVGVLSWMVNNQLIASTADNLNDFGCANVAQLHHLEANGEKDGERQSACSEIRQQRSELGSQRYRAQMNAFWLSAGESFELTAHPSANAKYAISKLSLSVQSNLESANGYSCTVACWPLAQPFRPERVTPVPSIAGMLTATVVGPDSEEIHTDEFGRIKIQFPWDEENKKDDSSSCWIRVAQPWAGNKFGALFLPRIGSEVLVSFIQGHPDHPVVTGSVYSNENPSPMTLPDDKNHTGFVSRSTLDGEVTDGHRIVFDDKKDEEKLIVGSQKDLLLTVNNDAQITIAANRTSELTEGNDLLTLKKGNSELTLEQGNFAQNLKKGAYSVTLDDGDYGLTLKGNQTIKVDGGEQKTTISGGGSLLKADKACVIESSKEIVFKVGGNEIAITSSGITLKGTKITIEGQADVAVKGAKVDLKGSAMVTIDGGLIKLG
ncbi:VgrG family protein [Buttiauxella gaviniae ATCC 51604]|uniref:VgrG family protein n=1 Tax=Buttiauxella gaviniae ATCC 51604 TaxID=1354253 RepID=A0A1B7I648_9ENTR|nr:type VI secretion system tip protein TssI/VgrG [Buttiauxella gaviniae]OAT23909.1 VgrG family protein [Buttiauxella gaviniae ATCC 51604]